MKHVNIMLFENFTALDAFGPAEVFSRFKDHYQLGYFSLQGGLVSSSADFKIETQPADAISQNDILFVPGGFGTRVEVSNPLMIAKLRELGQASQFVLCVCTGSALFSKTGLLDNKNATSNKIAWEWVIEQNRTVNWIRKARWVVDGKYYTSSGISAGIDMALRFISDNLGNEYTTKASNAMEYIWNGDRDNDPFA